MSSVILLSMTSLEADATERWTRRRGGGDFLTLILPALRIPQAHEKMLISFCYSMGENLCVEGLQAEVRLWVGDAVDGLCFMRTDTILLCRLTHTKVKALMI